MSRLLPHVATRPPETADRQPVLLGWIDFAPATGSVGREVRIAGWCFAPGGKLREVRVLLGRDRFICATGRVRDDVLAKFPGEAGADGCGFEVGVVPPRPWRGRLVIEAVLADGAVAVVDTAAKMKVKGPAGVVRRACRSWLQRRAAERQSGGEGGRLRVMCFTNDLNITGGPLNLMEVVTELKRRGEIEPVVVSPVDGWLRREFEAEGIEVLLRRGLRGLGFAGMGD